MVLTNGTFPIVSFVIIIGQKNLKKYCKKTQIALLKNRPTFATNFENFSA